MSLNLPPHLVAHLDQHHAAAEQCLDGLVKVARTLLAEMDPALASEYMAAIVDRSSRDTLSGALGHALVRLARQKTPAP